jgi:hypothetical protein
MRVEKKNFVGQPIFKQVINILPKQLFQELVYNLGTDRYYKTFYSWDQLICMLFGIFSRCDSMGEVCDGMRALAGKLNYLGLVVAPAKSTVGDALRDRSEELFSQFYYRLIEYFSSDLSVSRKKNRKVDVSFERFYAFDSSIISLFTDIMKGVGYNAKGDGKKKGGLKVHMITDIHADTPTFVKITDAAQNDINFLENTIFPKGSMAVFDRAYNFYLQYAKWTEAGVNFVGRLKKKAVYNVIDEPIFETELKAEEYGVFKVEHIHVEYKELVEVKLLDNTVKSAYMNQKKGLCLRLVHYKDEKGKIYEFITNNWDISANEVALCYKHRWTIETTFKKLKQNFQLRYFYSETENGIKTQVWCTLIAYLLLQVIQIRSESNKAFSTVASLIRMHLISHLCLNWVVTESRKTYPKTSKRKSRCPTAFQLMLPWS